MMNKNSRSQAARKAARTVRNRREFVNRFGERALNALVTIMRGTNVTSTSKVRSLAAYKANLTRGTYSDFVKVDVVGAIVSDSIGLSRLV